MIEFRQQQCEVCGNEPMEVVASIPFIPMSVAYGEECLKANAHPWWAIVANQATIGNELELSHPEWQQMVRDTCAHLGKTVDEFKADVCEVIAREGERRLTHVDYDALADSYEAEPPRADEVISVDISQEARHPEDFS